MFVYPEGIGKKMNSTIIQVNDLTKRYRDVLAVDHISFEIGEGEIFGFLGPNGAGKTTTIRMLTTLSRACPLALPFSFASTALLPASSMPTLAPRCRKHESNIQSGGHHSVSHLKRNVEQCSVYFSNLRFCFSRSFCGDMHCDRCVRLQQGTKHGVEDRE